MSDASPPSGIMSRPRYRQLTFDCGGTRHLLASDTPEPPPSAFTDAAPFAHVEHWNSITFDSPATLLEALRARLASERMGLRLYAIGTEPFLWDIARIAEAKGMGMEEIQLHHAGSLRRRVQCVHCQTMIEDVATSIVTCPGCHAALFVRDHFSRRLAAYQGVQVDAEKPGERPAPENIYQ